MERGSLGQCVGVIVTHIPEYKHHLCQISTDPSRPDKIRIAAIALAGEFSMYDVLSHIAANLDQVSWRDAYEAAKWAAEACADTDISESSLEEIVEHKGYDSDEIGFVLHDAGLYFLIRQEYLINQISNSTANSYVWLETSRALTRIMNWRYPPANYMDPLF